MESGTLDRSRVPQILWRSLRHLGVSPSAILQKAGLPDAVLSNDRTLVSTKQFFAIWHALRDVTSDQTFGIKIAEAAKATGHHPAFLAACSGANFRDGITRIWRYMRFSPSAQPSFEERDGLMRFTKHWPYATEPEPSHSIDLTFACITELGRRGTGTRIMPVRIEYERPGPESGFHQDYFGCEIRYAAPRNMLVLRSEDLALPFPNRHLELRDVLSPARPSVNDNGQAQDTLSERVKVALKRALASGRPDIADVALSLGLGERTLQRRITQEQTSFREILADARQELGQQLLAIPSVDIETVAFMLGYQDTSSFYRAFKDWSGLTPQRWRRLHNS
ncbi:AraC family transcriptional regulator [Sphingobium yanoikuyae]|uniref:AraC family transcriptional regulator n=1 Tax=Sphingobium yanoikuyae TaxID=13690 RepID=UPI0007C8670C|nr:AraC family transcriptional regulator [Sphingobium yanoikuyae]